MKKLFLSIMAITMIATTGKAQMTPRFGAELGVSENVLVFSPTNTNNAGITASSGFKLGFRVGGLVDLSFNEHFSLQPGLYFSQKGGKSLGSLFGSQGDMSINYLEIPVLLTVKLEDPRGFNTTSKYTIGAGPYLGIAMFGGNGVGIGKATAVDSSGNGVFGVKFYDLGLQIAAGREWDWGFFAKGAFGFSLVDISYDGSSAGNGWTMKNWHYAFTLGYLFGTQN